MARVGAYNDRNIQETERMDAIHQQVFSKYKNKMGLRMYSEFLNFLNK